MNSFNIRIPSELVYSHSLLASIEVQFLIYKLIVLFFFFKIKLSCTYSVWFTFRERKQKKVHGEKKVKLENAAARDKRVKMLHKNEISCNSNASMDSKINLKSMRYDFEGHREPDFIIVWETAVSPLTETQRITFFVLTIIVVIVALIGNALVLYVNFSR